MATDLIKSLRERLGTLRDELIADPKFQEYDLVTQLLSRHEASVFVTEVSAEPAEPSSQPRKLAPRRAVLASTVALLPTVERAVAARAPFQRTSTGMAAVVEASAEYLRRKGARADSSEIHAELIRRRILRSGPDERSKVTSYLGRKKELFDNVRGEGYGLREWVSASPP